MQDRMIVSARRERRAEREDVVSTLLEAIMKLEREPIRTVVLTGSFATDPELASSLVELYPSLDIERE